MNKRLIAKSMIALMLAANAPAFAQNHDRRDDRREYRDDRREDRRGAGPRHDLYRGNRLPSNYNHRQYVVDNWRAHRLSAPPRGHHWVQE